MPGRIKSIAAIIILTAIPLTGQMPDWKKFKDADGNHYYIDKNDKIIITGNPAYNFKPVSAKGIVYYLNHAIDLLKRHKHVEAVTILKTILALSVTDSEVYRARIQASQILNDYIKKNGSRYHNVNRTASLLVYKDDDRGTRVLNDLMFYSVSAPLAVEIIRKRIRRKNNYLYYGLSAGLSRKEKSRTAGKYDMLLAIDAEKYAIAFRDISSVENIWRHNLGFDVFRRKVIVKNNSRIVYRIEKVAPPTLSGYETVAMADNYIYIMRIVTPGGAAARNNRIMKSIVDNFKVIKK